MTFGRALLAGSVRALQAVTRDLDAHTLLRARANRWRESRRASLAPLPDDAFVDRRRVLVCRTEQRGDVILAIPALRALRVRYPAARITVLGGPWSVEILGAVPEVDEVLVLQHPPLAFEAGRMPTVEERTELLRQIRNAGFDLAVDLTGDPWTIRVLAEAGVALRVGPSDTGVSELLHRSVPIPPNLHRVDGMLAIVAQVGAVEGDAIPRLVPPDSARREADSIFGALGLPSPFMVVHPGGRSLKRWPVERFVELVDRLVRDTRDPIVLLSGPDEGDLRAAFTAQVESGRVRAWHGGSFLAAGEMIRRARLFVGNDSGFAHLAAAVGTPTVTIFGPARPSRWAPRSANGIALSTGESCSFPCWPAVYAEPCSHHRCVMNLPVDRIHDEVMKRLAGTPDPERPPLAGIGASRITHGA